jgi:hypothetical protein
VIWCRAERFAALPRVAPGGLSPTLAPGLNSTGGVISGIMAVRDVYCVAACAKWGWPRVDEFERHVV